MKQGNGWPARLNKTFSKQGGGGVLIEPQSVTGRGLSLLRQRMKGITHAHVVVLHSYLAVDASCSGGKVIHGVECWNVQAFITLIACELFLETTVK